MSPEDVPKKCTVKPDGTYTCNACGSDILAIEVKRSVWDFPEACAGSGEVRTEMVPYCPKCEEKPNWRGPPIIER